MDWDKVSDKDYHKALRQYREYMNWIVLENKQSDTRVYPLSFDNYAAQLLSKEDEKNK